MTKPALLQTLEQRFLLDFTHEEVSDPAIFSRYGRRGSDACRYWLRDGVLVGLCARASGIHSLDWLDSPALTQLEILLIGENSFEEITIPENWTRIKTIDLNASPELTSVEFAGDAGELNRLELSDCPELSQLELPENCPQLHFLDLRNSKLKSLLFDGDFSNLVYLDASHSSALKRIRLAGNFASLLSLHLRAAALEKLELTADFPVLDTLDMAENTSPKLELPAHLILNEQLLRLYARNCAPKNCRSHFLRQTNSVEKACTWFQELASGETERNKRIKLLFTGNGNVGKSTLLCALKAEDHWQCTCSADHSSTHGIQIGTFEQEGVAFSYWDFGGQDVYGATHQLFYADEAVQLIVYDVATEALAASGQFGDDRAGGQEVKHELPYFYYLLSQRSTHDSFLFVQNNKVEQAPAGSIPTILHAGIQAFAVETLPQQPPVLVDAKQGTGVESLMQRVLPLARSLPHYDMEFPATWLEVRQWFIDNDDDQKAGQVRRITKEYFTNTLCQSAGVTDSDAQEALLEDLAAAGYCYYRPEDRVMGQEIIVDQGWALEAIYRPLNRTEIAPVWRRWKGRIPVSMIYDALGEEFNENDRQLLLNFMEANGLCFPADKPAETDEEQTGRITEMYVFPVYLPAGYPEALELLTEKKEVLRFRAPVRYLDRTAFQQFLCQLGRKVDAFDHLSRQGIYLRTEEGRLGAWMNYADKCYEVFCEPGAANTWLQSLLEECPGDDWEVKSGNNYQPFPIDEFMGGQSGQEGKDLKTDLADRYDKLQEAPLDSRKELEAFQEMLEEMLVDNNYDDFFPMLKDKLVKSGKQYRTSRTLLSQYNSVLDARIEKSLRPEEQNFREGEIWRSCFDFIFRIEVEDLKS